VSPEQNALPITIVLGLPHEARAARVVKLDADHGDAGGAYARMGSPQYPTRSQLDELIKASALTAPEDLAIMNDRVSVTLPPNGLATLEVPMAGPRAGGGGGG
jgi:xylan 1,4-beta-xylosidase